MAAAVGCIFGYFGSLWFAPEAVAAPSSQASVVAPASPAKVKERSSRRSKDDEEPLYATGIGYKLGRINVTLSDGSERTELDKTILAWGRNFVQLSDLGMVWVRPKPVPVRKDEPLEQESVETSLELAPIEDSPLESAKKTPYNGFELPKFEQPEFKQRKFGT